MLEAEGPSFISVGRQDKASIEQYKNYEQPDNREYFLFQLCRQKHGCVEKDASE